MAIPAILAGKRIAVLGSASGLGLAVVRAAEAAGAEVHGIDGMRNFEGLSAFYRADLSDPATPEALAHSLPDDLDGLALFPALPDAGPADILAQGLIAPRDLALALGAKLAPRASILVRAAPMSHHWGDCLPETRAAMALRPSGIAGFVTRWGLDAEPARAPRVAGWAMLGFAMAQRWRWAARDIRINALTPASKDGYLPPEISAARGHDGARGIMDAAQAALFLLSDLSSGMTGANLASDGGLSAQIRCRHDGL
jgi:NAD(P)-dependent dehydrogenase (short-subunit alcohol dehydrogenase family)